MNSPFIIDMMMKKYLEDDLKFNKLNKLKLKDNDVLESKLSHKSESNQLINSNNYNSVNLVENSLELNKINMNSYFDFYQKNKDSYFKNLVSKLLNN